MTMKRNILISILVTLFPFSSIIAGEFNKNQIRDLALIYQGGIKRIDWTQEQFIPYVTHTFANGKTEWLFDGFLFLDFNNGDSTTYVPQWGAKKGTKSDWEWYLNRLFEKGKSLDALDACITAQKKKIGKPGFQHKIVLTLPTPLTGAEWGDLDGIKLDFESLEDQTKACVWFMNELVRRFKEANYKNLELTGLYWVDEDMWHTRDVTKLIAPYVHELGLEFVWIPYYKARGYDCWKELGFDIAYHQPNHFFKMTVSDSQLDEACTVAKDLGMAMEFECDKNAMFHAPNSLYGRMQSYIDAFIKHKVFETSAIAYYTGSHYFLDVYENPTPEDQYILDELCRFIVKRRANKKLIPSKKCTN